MTRKTKYVAAPEGMYGLLVEPWTPGEIYAVAADWAQASAPIYTMDADGWTRNGRQVADYRHQPAIALRSILRNAIEAGGEASEEELDAIVGGARELISKELGEICEVLGSYGHRFTGDNVVSTAQEWADNDFDADAVSLWCDVGVWDADTAAQFRDEAGLSPADVAEAKGGAGQSLARRVGLHRRYRCLRRYLRPLRVALALARNIGYIPG